MRPMTAEEVEKAARADTGARPMTPEGLATVRRAPLIKTLRCALGLTQQEFAARYRVPLGRLRNWEQGRSEPDQIARAHLKVIARDPECIRRALARGVLSAKNEELPVPSVTYDLFVQAMAGRKQILCTWGLYAARRCLRIRERISAAASGMLVPGP